MTIALVFGPKVVRVLRGQGDQWDNRARVRGITASFSLNGTGLVPEDSPDLYQENEELKVIRNIILFQHYDGMVVNLNNGTRILGFFFKLNHLTNVACNKNTINNK